VRSSRHAKEAVCIRPRDRGKGRCSMIPLLLLVLQQFPSTMPDPWNTQDTLTVALATIPLAC